MKRVLAIGGSAFAGRVFSIQAAKNPEIELHVVNRGQFPLNLQGVKEYRSDRYNPRLVAHLLKDLTFDAVVDFTAYSPGVVSSLMTALQGRFKQYILFSSCAVYTPYRSEPIAEDGEVLSRSDGSAASESAYNKLLLEKELIKTCGEIGAHYTIFRPTFIYGPFNYSARESHYIELIARGHVVPYPVDATSRFSLVYVFDVARALMATIGNEKAYDEIFNLAAPELITHARLFEAFEEFNGGPIMTRPVTIEDILNENIAVPFPLTEDVLYSGKKFAETMEFEYTPFMEGMDKTYKSFYSLFIS
ncbi:MAG TPA: NAD-dependent epimerase/dehydratase family protein [Papillibacter sp.]|nr:NAD-dependent epimerase/dehydratase family protein [Papillibacter sp.]